MQTVTLPDVVLAVRVDGDPAAPAVLLLHGLGRDGSDLAAVGAALAPRHRVIAPDLRGHGGSGRAQRYGFGPMREDAVGLLDALGVDRADVVGHSMGATVAWLLAEEHPDRVRRLVVLDTVPPRGRREYEPPEEPDEELPFDWPLVPAVLRDLAQPDPAWWDRLGDITAPTLLIGGGPDSHVEQAELAAAASMVPDCRLVTLGGGHRLHVTSTAELTAEVVPFLANHRRADHPTEPTTAEPTTAEPPCLGVSRRG